MPTAIITAVELLIGFNRASIRPPEPNRDPLRLVRVLRSCGHPLSPALEQTAVLHGMLDGIDDPAKLQQAIGAIRRVCGEDVAAMARSLAKDPAHDAYPPHVREQRYLLRLSCHALRHPEILLVKLAEVILSLTEIRKDSSVESCLLVSKIYNMYLPIFDSNKFIQRNTKFPPLRAALVHAMKQLDLG